MDGCGVGVSGRGEGRCREMMVEGRLSKLKKDMALLEQPFIKDNNITVGDVIKSAIAEFGENIKVRLSHALLHTNPPHRSHVR